MLCGRRTTDHACGTCRFGYGLDVQRRITDLHEAHLRKLEDEGNALASQEQRDLVESFLADEEPSEDDPRALLSLKPGVLYRAAIELPQNANKEDFKVCVRKLITLKEPLPNIISSMHGVELPGHRRQVVGQVTP
ncbi:uncharacterized protein LOC135391815 [Ornithodoros turicata]|uniref:uncharacterized protein LOC135391815 n=1 Tax=Ornithodoros turicata TaxID=34597 RepID=UPI00313887E5